MLPLRSPRRFRRPLLLPPGWVALGGLLLVGCLLLRAHWRQLRPATVVQLNMPRLRPAASLQAYYRLFGRIDAAAEYNPYVASNDKDAQVRIDHMRPWQRFYLENVASADSRCLLAIELAIKAMQADTSRANGIRIEFAKSVPYARMVGLLDLLNRLNYDRYWVDIRHRYLTFYVVSPRPLTLAERRQKVAEFSEMANKGADFSYAVPSQTIAQRIRQLSSPWRRPQVLLTGAMGALLLVLLTATLVVARSAIR